MYKVYLDDMRLPVTPEEITLKVKNQNKTLTMINEGEVNILKRPGLSDIKFDCILPNSEYPFAVYDSGYQGAEYFLGRLEEFKTSIKPFTFQIIRTESGGRISSFDQELTVSLESYEITENAEKYGSDILVTISLKQYTAAVTKVVVFEAQTDDTSDTTEAVIQEERDTSTKEELKEYTVVSGDTLWGIAKREYGNGSRWGEIYDLNTEVIEATARQNGLDSSSNGHWIYPGEVLRLR